MNTTRNLIRSCSGSLAVQHFARRTVASSPRTQFLAVGSRRFYSEDTKPSERKREGESKDAGPSKDESEFSIQLAAKEEEVTDLKVCIFFRDRWHSVTDICSVESAKVSSGRLYQPPAQLCERKGADKRLCHHKVCFGFTRDRGCAVTRSQICSPRSA